MARKYNQKHTVSKLHEYLAQKRETLNQLIISAYTTNSETEVRAYLEAYKIIEEVDNICMQRKRY